MNQRQQTKNRNKERMKEELRENASHGTIGWPIALYEWQGDQNWHVTPHWHEEIEFICFKEGIFRVWLNTREYIIESPALLCVHPQELHSIMLTAGGRESAIVFSLDILSFEHYDAIQAQLISPLMDGRLRFPTVIQEQDASYSILRAAYDRAEEKIRAMNTFSIQQEIEKNTYYLEVKAILLEVLAHLYRNNCLVKEPDLRTENEQQIANLKKVITYIMEHYDVDMRLDELACLVNMNPQYFCRYFKKNIGKTITEYINEVRIEKAAQALAETNDKIIDIAQNCGYENVSYFIRRFRRIKGMTPVQYREMSK